MGWWDYTRRKPATTVDLPGICHATVKENDPGNVLAVDRMFFRFLMLRCSNKPNSNSQKEDHVQPEISQAHLFTSIFRGDPGCLRLHGTAGSPSAEGPGSGGNAARPGSAREG